MKMTETEQAFTPRTFTLTIESQEELDTLKHLLSYDQSIPKLIYDSPSAGDQRALASRLMGVMQEAIC